VTAGVSDSASLALPVSPMLPTLLSLCTLNFPTVLKGRTLPGLWVDFFVDNWCHVIGNEASPTVAPSFRAVKNVVKVVVEVCQIFLTEPIPILPSNARNGHSIEAAAWRANVKWQCSLAWDRARIFLEANGKKVSTAVSSFEKAIKSIDPDKWPMGGCDLGKYGLRAIDAMKEDIHNNKQK
jgi:hypothetical protein